MLIVENLLFVPVLLALRMTRIWLAQACYPYLLGQDA